MKPKIKIVKEESNSCIGCFYANLAKYSCDKIDAVKNLSQNDRLRIEVHCFVRSVIYVEVVK